MTHYLKHILIVDDDSKLRLLLEQFLSQQGFAISTASNTTQARSILAQQSIDVIVMDVMMPNETGVEFTRYFKSKNAIPILLLTAMDEVEDRIAGLESGADDYLTKPFEPRELLLRIENLIQRNPINKLAVDNKVVFGTYCYNLSTKELRCKDQTIDIILTLNEQTLLCMLAGHINQPISREELAQQLNGISHRSVDVQITRLRKKIEVNPRNPVYLRTVRGKGYILRSAMVAVSSE